MGTIPPGASSGLLDEGLFEVYVHRDVCVSSGYIYTVTPCHWARCHISECSRKLKLVPFSSDNRNKTVLMLVWGSSISLV